MSEFICSSGGFGSVGNGCYVIFGFSGIVGGGGGGGDVKSCGAGGGVGRGGGGGGKDVGRLGQWPINLIFL